MKNRSDFVAYDLADPLSPLRGQFSMPEGLIYLDGNSLGVLPKRTVDRVKEVVIDEWGDGLIRSWNAAGWISMAARVGDKIASLVGARPGELVATDSTSINLHKVLAAACTLAQAKSNGRVEILSENGNFPTDLYIAQGLTNFGKYGLRVRTVPRDEILAALSEQTAVLMLTHVNYKTGQMWDMESVTATAHARGALVVWDLAHSAGAVPVDLHQAKADFAVGCGYKYLNGGPGAPAFVWVNPQHADQAMQPLSGWLGHAAPFNFDPDYRPASGISQFLCGTPPVISLAALECGVDTHLAAQSLGGMRAIREKSIALTKLFIDLVEQRCAGFDLQLVSPRDPSLRGSQVSFASKNAYPIMQALIAHNLVGDFRAPDVLRFGFTPLYTRYVDVWDAVETLRNVLQTGSWQDARFNARQVVT